MVNIATPDLREINQTIQGFEVQQDELIKQRRAKRTSSFEHCVMQASNHSSKAAHAAIKCHEHTWAATPTHALYSDPIELMEQEKAILEPRSPNSLSSIQSSQPEPGPRMVPRTCSATAELAPSSNQRDPVGPPPLTLCQFGISKIYLTGHRKN